MRGSPARVTAAPWAGPAADASGTSPDDTSTEESRKPSDDAWTWSPDAPLPDPGALEPDPGIPASDPGSWTTAAAAPAPTALLTPASAPSRVPVRADLPACVLRPAPVPVPVRAPYWTPDERVPERPDFPRSAVREALAAERVAPPGCVIRGTTHRNSIVYVPSRGVRVVVRRLVPDRARLERCFLSEHAVLAAIERSGVPVRAPRVLALGTDHAGGVAASRVLGTSGEDEDAFAIHSYEGLSGLSCEGPSTAGTGPRHPVQGLLPREADDVVAQLEALTRVDHRLLDPAAERVDFYAWLCEELAALVGRLPATSWRLAREFGLPDGPRLREILGRHRVRQRDVALLHGDLNPWNLVRGAGPDAGLVLIDWEMAMVGDPLYDLARHLHLTPTLPDIRTRMLTAWHRRLPERFTRGWEADLRLYRAIEVVRSAYVDLHRLVTHAGLDAPNVRRAVDAYAMTLHAATAFLGLRQREPATEFLTAASRS